MLRAPSVSIHLRSDAPTFWSRSENTWDSLPGRTGVPNPLGSMMGCSTGRLKPFRMQNQVAMALAMAQNHSFHRPSLIKSDQFWTWNIWKFVTPSGDWRIPWAWRLAHLHTVLPHLVSTVRFKYKQIVSSATQDGLHHWSKCCKFLVCTYTVLFRSTVHLHHIHGTLSSLLIFGVTVAL